MEAIIVNYRRGRHTQRTNQAIIEVEGVTDRASASRFIGKRLVWRTPSGKEIYGKIIKPHGNKGNLRARFSRGLPGIALGTKVEILER